MLQPLPGAATLPLALTAGEPAGIGPDITLQAWRARHEAALPPFYLVGNPDFIARRAAELRIEVKVAAVRSQDAGGMFAEYLPVVAINEKMTATAGKSDKTSAPAVIAAIRHAATDVMDGNAAALVTNPIAKSVLYDAGFDYPGHTEFLAALAQERTGRTVRPVMMLHADGIAAVPVTIHIALRDVPAILTADLIVETGRITAHDLRQRFGIAHPRLAIAGLNPHAGEHGALGQEDAQIVRPAVERLRAEGIDTRGPLPADTMFHAAARATYDAALCMYHDQALIPVKTLAFECAVNVTLGLPFVRTSPDHGTAFDIAGTGRADPSSLIAALKLAARMAASTSARVSAQ